MPVLPSFAMDTAHNFGPEFQSEKPVRVLHENKISTGLQIRRSNKDNLGIIIHISSEKHIL